MTLVEHDFGWELGWGERRNLARQVRRSRDQPSAVYYRDTNLLVLIIIVSAVYYRDLHHISCLLSSYQQVIIIISAVDYHHEDEGDITPCLYEFVSCQVLNLVLHHSGG